MVLHDDEAKLEAPWPKNPKGPFSMTDPWDERYIYLHELVDFFWFLCRQIYRSSHGSCGVLIVHQKGEVKNTNSMGSD